MQLYCFHFRDHLPMSGLRPETFVPLLCILLWEGRIICRQDFGRQVRSGRALQYRSNIKFRTGRRKVLPVEKSLGRSGRASGQHGVSSHYRCEIVWIGGEQTQPNESTPVLNEKVDIFNSIDLKVPVSKQCVGHRYNRSARRVCLNAQNQSDQDHYTMPPLTNSGIILRYKNDQLGSPCNNNTVGPRPHRYSASANHPSLDNSVGRKENQ